MNTAQIHQRYIVSSGVSTDTRNIQKDSIFFALRGIHFNGNHYAEEALEKGAKFVVIDEKEFIREKYKQRYILVKDVLLSLQELAGFHRKYLGLPIIAITGSNGKTTTKELLHSVLTKKHNTIATRGNLNNHIGVPLTLLSMDEETEVGIIEMGANHPGEIHYLCKIAQPDYGYITSFGKAHLEGFGSLEGVIKAKSELYDYLKKHKKLIFINDDDEVQRTQYGYSHVFSFGTGKRAKVKTTYPASSSFAQVQYNKTLFTSRLSGKFNATNIAAALCIGLYFKVPFTQIKEAIEEYSPNNNRSQIIEEGSNTVIMDAYNANPTSMLASLQNFEEIKTKNNKIAILGDMMELGDASETEHQVIVNFLSNSNITESYLVGENFRKTEINEPTIIKFKSIEDLREHLKLSPIQNSHILIKGSRSMALEELQDVL